MTKSCVLLQHSNLSSVVTSTLACKMYDNILRVTFIYGNENYQIDYRMPGLHNAWLTSDREEDEYEDPQDRYEVDFDNSLVTNFAPQTKQYPTQIIGDNGWRWIVADRGWVPKYLPPLFPMFVLHSAGLAWEEDKNDVVWGFHQEDCKSKPDGLNDSLQDLIDVAFDREIPLKAPLKDLTKTQIVKLGDELDVNWNLSYSCIHPTNPRKLAHCGECYGCKRRWKAFDEAEVHDPLREAYKVNPWEKETQA